MSANHTPGPWFYGISSETEAFVVDENADHVIDLVASPYTTAQSDLPNNARLVASAPMLLAALQMFDRWPAAHQQDGLKAAFAAARAAINRAIGEEV